MTNKNSSPILATSLDPIAFDANPGMLLDAISVGYPLTAVRSWAIGHYHDQQLTIASPILSLGDFFPTDMNGADWSPCSTREFEIERIFELDESTVQIGRQNIPSIGDVVTHVRSNGIGQLFPQKINLRIAEFLEHRACSETSIFSRRAFAFFQDRLAQNLSDKTKVLKSESINEMLQMGQDAIGCKKIALVLEPEMNSPQIYSTEPIENETDFQKLDRVSQPIFLTDFAKCSRNSTIQKLLVSVFAGSKTTTNLSSGTIIDLIIHGQAAMFEYAAFPLIEAHGTIHFWGPLSTTGLGAKRALLDLFTRSLSYHLAQLNMLHEQETRLEFARSVIMDVSHQLKGSIAQASMHTQMLLKNKDGRSDKDARHLRALTNLLQQTHHVAESIRFLDSLRAGEFRRIRESRLSNTDIINTIVDVIKNLEALVASQRNISIQLDRSNLLNWNGRVILDRGLLQLALHEVIDNAIKYSYPDTRIVISPIVTKNGHLRISVSNKGLPIERQDVKHIFKEGFRGASAMATTADGRGLGMYMVKSIMNAHRGQVMIETHSEEATNVSLDFPITDMPPNS